MSTYIFIVLLTLLLIIIRILLTRKRVVSHAKIFTSGIPSYSEAKRILEQQLLKAKQKYNYSGKNIEKVITLFIHNNPDILNKKHIPPKFYKLLPIDNPLKNNASNFKPATSNKGELSLVAELLLKSPIAQNTELPSLKYMPYPILSESTTWHRGLKECLGCKNKTYIFPKTSNHKENNLDQFCLNCIESGKYYRTTSMKTNTTIKTPKDC